jgi:hypothetical protein
LAVLRSVVWLIAYRDKKVVGVFVRFVRHLKCLRIAALDLALCHEET